MGYGAGHELKIKSNGGQVLFTGRSLKVMPEFESWDLTHPMDGMTKIKMDLLKVKVANIVLTKEEIKDLKEQGIQKGEYISFKFEDELKGCLWSGYVRSSTKNSFPIEMRGEIYLYTAHGYYNNVAVSVKYNNLKEFDNFIEDVLDYFVSDEDAELYAKEEDISVESAREELYETNQQDCLENYGAK